MTREEFEYSIKSCGFLIHQGQTYYEESELIKVFEDMGLIEQEPTDRIEYGTDGNAYKLWISNGKEYEPKTGHWIEKDGFDGDTYYDCSECGESFCLIDGTPTDNLYNYCPNCGARMEREDKE